MKARSFHWHSLKTRLTLFTLTIFVAGIWALSLYIGRILQADMQELMGQQQFSTASYVAAQVGEEVRDRMAALEVTASELDAGLIGNPSALQAWLEGRPILQILFNVGVLATDAEGTAVADVPLANDRVGTNYRDRDFVLSVIRDGKSSVGRPVMGEQLKSPIFAMAVPIRDAQGKVVGILMGVTDLGKHNFLDNLTRDPYGRTGGYLLIDPRARQIITATDKKRVMERLPAAGLHRYVDRNIAGYEGHSVLVNALGVEQLASVKQIAAAGWYIQLGTPTTEAFAPIDTMLQRTRLATLLLTLLAGALTWWVLRRQLAPLVATADAMAALANADQIPQPLPVHGQDEIGQLSSGFNRLITTWVEREAALKESQQNLAITLDSIGDAVIATDRTGCVTRMNPTAERLCGWTLDQARGRALVEVFCIVDANSRKPALDPVQRVMELGQVVGLANHTVLIARDGQEYQIADSAAPIRDAAQDIVGMVLVFSDVTEKYRVQAALLESTTRLRTVVESTREAIAVHRDGAVVFVNPAAIEMMGAASEQELLGKSILEFVHPDFRPAVLARIEAQINDGLPTPIVEERFVRLDATVIDVEVQARPIVYLGQAATQVAMRDITERKKAELRLQLAANVFAHAREGIIISDAAGTIIDVNQAFTRITGYSREEAIGQNPRIRKSGRQDQAFYAEMWRSLIDQGHWTGEIWNRRRDGEVYPELLTISSVQDALGRTAQYVALFSDISAIKEHEHQLQRIAHFDALTNLPNRVLLADRLQLAMTQALRRGQQLAVAYIDLDGFKAVNDQHGHAVGDQVLVGLTLRMKEALRDGDTVARLGGDEFVALLIDLDDSSDCLPLLTRLLAAAAQPIQVGELRLQISASLGVTFYPQAQETDADQLLRQADRAMYHAKVAGKNRYQLFDAAQDSHLRRQHENLARIRLALERREFVLHYQPKVNMRSGKVVGAEALIRWLQLENGLLAPSAFLPMIKDDTLAVAVGEWVIDTALTQIERWRADGLDLPVSVNIGALQLQQSDFAQRLQFILASHPQVQPGWLELEVMETSALDDIECVSAVIEACTAIGVRFALDDFGSGHSSLTHLRRLRVGRLKIGQSFVRNMLVDAGDLAILKGIIGLAAAFNRQVIAEGVETVAHGTLLLQLGCELAQGYCIARPMQADELPAWVATWRPDVAWCKPNAPLEGG